MSDDSIVIKYLHSGDTIRWLDPSTGATNGPSTITGFGTAGMDGEGRMVSTIMITPWNGIGAVAPITLLSRVSASDGTVMRFRAGVPV